MATSGIERRLCAILFTDIVGSSRVTGADEQAGLRLRDRHRVLVREHVERHRGRLIEAPGDETLSTFGSALDAVNAALAIRAVLVGDSWLALSTGIHLGETLFRGGEVFGDSVNIAARIRALAAPGEILVSGEVASALRNRPEIEASPRGEHALKNVERPVSVFAIASSSRARERDGEGAALAPARATRRVVVKWLPAAALAAFAIALGSGELRHRFIASPSPPKLESLAVLPLENLSRDPAQEYFADGMTESLITELSGISGLRVISRTSAMKYKRTRKTIPEVARELGVDAIIEGSVMREGGQVRITIQLIHGATDRHLWAHSFDRDSGGVLALHSEVARAVAKQIAVELTPQERTRLTSSPRVKPGAYELYVLGRHYWNLRTIEGYRRATEQLRKALALDSGYAPAHAALADTYMLLGEQGGLPQQDARALAADEIRRALDLDPNLAEAHASLGAWKLHYEWSWPDAEREFRRALELSPGFAAGHQRYGRSLGFVGRFEEGLRELQRARELDPLSVPVNAHLGQVFIFAGEYERAAEQLKQTLTLDPNHPLTHHNLGELYLAQGRYDDAVASLERANAVSGKPIQSHYLAVLGYAYARADRRPQALEILDELRRRSEQGLVSAFDMAVLCVGLGDEERAFEWLERGYQERDHWLVEIEAWPWFDSMRDDARYRSLLRRVNLWHSE